MHQETPAHALPRTTNATLICAATINKLGKAVNADKRLARHVASIYHMNVQQVTCAKKILTKTGFASHLIVTCMTQVVTALNDSGSVRGK
jgi:uncharacterized metal-binding protein